MSMFLCTLIDICLTQLFPSPAAVRSPVSLVAPLQLSQSQCQCQCQSQRYSPFPPYSQLQSSSVCVCGSSCSKSFWPRSLSLAVRYRQWVPFDVEPLDPHRTHRNHRMPIASFVSRRLC
ncbi:uncharacterized protein LOC108162461 [Drosophila miranda]|uniref:uncharacterized protein LOC108162461 n=1 Tax=Drosophila miranda TaxID=7229 RepID=UPI00143F06CC|nr:uncharacterized protein LOC108162461 [Drosophila miranda]